MYNDGVPTTKYNWSDTSGAKSDVLFSNPVDGLYVPFGFVLAERGIPGQIYFGAAKELTKALGAATFDPTSKYFNASNQMLGYAMAGAGVQPMRLVDPAAKTATLGLFLKVTSTPLTQYVKDATGARVFDGQGNYIPRTTANGTVQVVEPGVTLLWEVRELDEDESFDQLVHQTVQVGGNNVTTYPILGLEVLSPGLYGIRQGFKLASTGQEDSTLVRALGAMLYRFSPVELASDATITASAIPDFLGSTSNDVTFKDTSLYTQTNTNYAFNFVIGNSYIDQNTGEQALPYNLHVYGENVGIVAAQALGVSPELGAIDPYLIDLIAGSDMNGNLYDHIDIDDASSTVIGGDVINYAVGGTDGDTSWAMLNQLTYAWLTGNDHGEFTNLQQHPMTHCADPGFAMATKVAMFNMLDLRDNIKLDISTQDIALKLNTKAQDISAGQALSYRAQMHPESTINGVPCCRVSIWAHAAPLIGGSPLGGNVPFTLNRVIQRRNLDGGLYIKGSSGGQPNSNVTIFRKPNWVADDLPSQTLSWSTALNTVRHADRVTLHYPSMRTVYTNDTSLLSDDEVADRIMYMMKLCRKIYAKYAGVRDAPKDIFKRIEKDIDDTLATAFGTDNLKVKSTVFQTAADANLGYQVSINLAVTGNMAIRTFNFNVNVSRAAS